MSLAFLSCLKPCAFNWVIKPIHVQSYHWKIWIYCYHNTYSVLVLWIISLGFLFGSPLIFLAELVWWSHILSVSAYPGSSLSLLFWMTALLDKVFLDTCFSHSGPWIYPASPFWPARSLWRSLLLLILLPIWIKNLLSYAALRIFSLSLELASFTIKCWGVERFLLILGGISLFPVSECLFPFPD